MFYRVILDCRPAASCASQAFLTIKFVEAENQEVASYVAKNRTKMLMSEKGFGDAEIASFEFATEGVAPFNKDEVEWEVERSFIYYSDDLI